MWPMYGKLYGVANINSRDLVASLDDAALNEKNPAVQGFSMRSNGLEPSRAVKPTRPSTLRVYQFRHERRVREYSPAGSSRIAVTSS
jgi:hypothetical protein